MLKAPVRKSAPPIEPGCYPAVCSKVVDLGTQDSTFGPRRQVLLAWQIPSERLQMMLDGVAKNLPREISRRFTLSLNEKAALRGVVESWRGRKLSDQELSGFDLEDLVGKPCLVQVTNNPSRDGTRIYSNVSNVMALPKGTTAPTLEQGDFGTTFSLDALKDPVLPAYLPTWIQTVISESQEFTRLCGVNPGQPAAPDPAWLHGAGQKAEEEIPM